MNAKFGEGIFWRRWGKITNESPEVQWLAERSEVAVYIVVVVSYLFGSWGVTRSYTFARLPRPRGRHTLLVAEAEAKMEVGAK